MTKKIILINSNLIKPPIGPIGLDYLADPLEAAGFEPRLVDLALAGDMDAAIREAYTGEPLLTGLTVRNIDDCYMATAESFIPTVRDIVAKIKKQSDAPVVLGGVGYSVSPVTALEALNADYGIWGEGEWVLPELAKRLAEKKSVEDVPGLLYRDDDAIQANRPVFGDLATLPPRSRSLIDNGRYFELGGQGGFETKRGCPMGCIYCADPVAKGGSSRLMPPENVASEVEALLRQGVDALHTCESEFNIPGGHAMEVCRVVIGRGLGEKVKWYAYLAPAPFGPKLANLMRRAGCAGINFGADSLDGFMLKSLGRQHSPKDVEVAVSECRKHDIKVMLDLLVGGPGETPDTVRRSIEAVKRIDPDRVGISLGVRVFPGTPLAERLSAEDVLLSRPKPYPTDELLYPAYYISPELGERPEDLVADIVDDDPRFFFADRRKKDRNYNYHDNSVLVEAINRGHRGAYWDILRKLADYG